MIKQSTLNIKGMSCSGCVSSVERALRGVHGVSSVKAELKPGKAMVEYDPAVTNEKELVQAITKAGYRVE